MIHMLRIIYQLLGPQGRPYHSGYWLVAGRGDGGRGDARRTTSRRTASHGPSDSVVVFV